MTNNDDLTDRVSSPSANAVFLRYYPVGSIINHGEKGVGVITNADAENKELEIQDSSGDKYKIKLLNDPVDSADVFSVGDFIQVANLGAGIIRQFEINSLTDNKKNDIYVIADFGKLPFDRIHADRVRGCKLNPGLKVCLKLASAQVKKWPEEAPLKLIAAILKDRQVPTGKNVFESTIMEEHPQEIDMKKFKDFDAWWKPLPLVLREKFATGTGRSKDKYSLRLKFKFSDIEDITWEEIKRKTSKSGKSKAKVLNNKQFISLMMEESDAIAGDESLIYQRLSSDMKSLKTPFKELLRKSPYKGYTRAINYLVKSIRLDLKSPKLSIQSIKSRGDFLMEQVHELIYFSFKHNSAKDNRAVKVDNEQWQPSVVIMDGIISVWSLICIHDITNKNRAARGKGSKTSNSQLMGKAIDLMVKWWPELAGSFVKMREIFYSEQLGIYQVNAIENLFDSLSEINRPHIGRKILSGYYGYNDQVAGRVFDAIIGPGKQPDRIIELILGISGKKDLQLVKLSANKLNGWFGSAEAMKWLMAAIYVGSLSSEAAELLRKSVTECIGQYAMYLDSESRYQKGIIEKAGIINVIEEPYYHIIDQLRQEKQSIENELQKTDEKVKILQKGIGLAENKAKFMANKKLLRIIADQYIDTFISVSKSDEGKAGKEFYMAGLRSILKNQAVDIYGEAEAEVKFELGEHQYMEGVKGSGRKVKVIYPGFVWTNPDGDKEILRHAIVDNA
jgi:hypothetical protein